MPDERRHQDHFWYEQWHRVASLERFVSRRIAIKLLSFNLDNPDVSNIFVCDNCQFPYAIAEDTSKWDGHKTTRWTTNLARLADLPAYLIRFEPADRSDSHSDLIRFKVNQTHPTVTTPIEQTPLEHALWLWNLSLEHAERCWHPRAIDYWNQALSSHLENHDGNH